ncbi:hypothetical protein REPUB_Repub02eG0019100 [Reevesia pubescens]
MEQSYDSPVTMEEIEVANMILELPYLIYESESLPRFSFTWGVKRKRSAASKQEVVFAAKSLPTLKLSPSSQPSPPPSLPSNAVGSTHKTEEPIEKVLTSTSPATPLSFSPSESDEKPLPPKKKAYVNGFKKKKEQLLETAEDLTRCNESLKKEIENRTRILDQLKTENLELIAKKQKVSQSLLNLTPKELCLETCKSLNVEIQISPISMGTENPTTSQDYHHHQQKTYTRVYQQQPYIKDQRVCKSEIMNKNSQYPFGQMISFLPSNSEGGLRKVHDNVGPLGLFDLNVSAEEAFGFSSLQSIDLDTVTKARAAQARFKRKQICRSKNYNAALKARYPFR